MLLEHVEKGTKRIAERGNFGHAGTVTIFVVKVLEMFTVRFFWFNVKFALMELPE